MHSQVKHFQQIRKVLLIKLIRDGMPKISALPRYLLLLLWPDFQVEGSKLHPMEVDSNGRVSEDQEIALSSPSTTVGETEDFLKLITDGEGFVQDLTEFRKSLELYPVSKITSWELSSPRVRQLTCGHRPSETSWILVWGSPESHSACLFVRVCVYVDRCTCVCVCVHAHVRESVCVCVSVCVCICACVHERECLCVYVCAPPSSCQLINKFTEVQEVWGQNCNEWSKHRRWGIWGGALGGSLCWDRFRQEAFAPTHTHTRLFPFQARSIYTHPHRYQTVSGKKHLHPPTQILNCFPFRQEAFTPTHTHTRLFPASICTHPHRY